MVHQTAQAISSKRIIWTITALLLQVMAFSDSLIWLADKITISPQEGFALSITLLLSCFVAITNPHKSGRTPSLLPTCLWLCSYGLAYLFLPSIVPAAIALISILTFLYSSIAGKRPPIALWMMILLSLPIIHSLQFYLGYPARLISAALTVPLLQLNGFMVSQEGTYLLWQDHLLQFDAPCSGIKMLWAGLFLTSILSFLYQFSVRKTGGALLLCLIIVLFGNVLRTSSLFYLESGLLQRTIPWEHEAIGIIAFSIASLCLLITLDVLNKWRFGKTKA